MLCVALSDSLSVPAPNKPKPLLINDGSSGQKHTGALYTSGLNFLWTHLIRCHGGYLRVILLQWESGFIRQLGLLSEIGFGCYGNELMKFAVGKSKQRGITGC